MSGSNPSLESQLANDFRQRANLASPSASSLGRLGSSTMNLHGIPSLPSTDVPTGSSPSAAASSYSFADPRLAIHGHGYSQGGGQGSAPTSPYGQPAGKAVAMGQGIGRVHGYDQGHGLGRADRQGQNGYAGYGASAERLGGVDGEADGHINPIFRVVSLAFLAIPSVMPLRPFDSILTPP